MEGFQRWWLASLCLWVMVIANSLGVVMLVVVLSGFLHMHTHMTTSVTVQVYALVGMVAQIGCIVAIFRWHRWGFWGLLILGIITFAVNVASRHNLILASSGLAGIAFCYLVLKGGGKSAVWPRLR